MTRRANGYVPTMIAGALALASLPAALAAQTPPAPAPKPAPAAAPAAPAPADAAGELEVTVTYKGKGEVSPAHEISVFLFADPNITEASEPVGVGTIEANGGRATFTGLPSVVYIAVVYDEAGTYERQGPPTPGTPVTIHGMAAGAPEAVKPGKGAKVSVTFDDSNRM